MVVKMTKVITILLIVTDDDDINIGIDLKAKTKKI